MLLLKPSTKRLSTAINDLNRNPEVQSGLHIVHSGYNVIGIDRA